MEPETVRPSRQLRQPIGVGGDMRKLHLVAFVMLCTLATVTSVFAADPPARPTKDGIYVLADGQYVLVDESLSTEDSDSGIGSALTFGLKGGRPKHYAKIEGKASSARVAEGTVTFLFVGEKFKPALLSLVRLESKGNERKVIVGKAGMVKPSTGFEKDSVIEVKFKQIDNGVWASEPVQLSPGQELGFSRKTAKDETYYTFGVDRMPETKLAGGQ